MINEKLTLYCKVILVSDVLTIVSTSLNKIYTTIYQAVLKKHNRTMAFIVGRYEKSEDQDQGLHEN